MVEATTIDRSSALAGTHSQRDGASATISGNEHRRRIASDLSCSSQITRSPRRKRRLPASPVIRRNSAAVPRSRSVPRSMKIDVAGEPAHLAEIVRGHHDLDAGSRRAQHDLLDAAGRGRIEARGGLVEQQDFGIARQRARQRQPLLLAAGQPPRRPRRQIGQARRDRAGRQPRAARWLRGMPACASA